LLADADIAAAQKTLLAALAECRGSVVIVSNEVGGGIVPEAALSRRFREHQGRLNQALGAQADFAALVVAGLPIVLKGTPPEAHS
jgi:adenosylcobinamide kinase/adenosylcobinamide-phosphate guanylyltransferase